MHAVVTSFGPEGWRLYGQRFVESFRVHWKDIPLICAWEGPAPVADLNGFDLLETEPCKSFVKRHQNNKIVQGRQEAAPAMWTTKARRSGYSYRHDAYKFARKVFAVCQAARFTETGKLFWIDADVVAHSTMHRGVLDLFLPDYASMCYLSREAWNVHSELGFVGYNLENIETLAFLCAYEDQYEHDLFLENSTGWDDCTQFDRLVQKRKPSNLRKIATTSRAQPFDQSMLAHYMRHNKGMRKVA